MSFPTENETPRIIVATTQLGVEWFTETERKIHAVGGEVVAMRNRGNGVVALKADPDKAAIAAGKVVLLRPAMGVDGVPLMVAGNDAAGGAPVGVLLETTSPGAMGRVAVSGPLPPSLTGITTAASYGLVRINTTTGMPERVTVLGGNDTLIGYCTPDGQLVLIPPMPVSPSRWQATVNPHQGTGYTWQVQGDTTDATPLALGTFAPPTGVESIVEMTGTFLAIRDTGAARWKIDVEACFQVTAGGVVTEMGANSTTPAKTQGTTTSMAAAIDTAAGNIRAMVTGRAGETFRWTANLAVNYRTAAAG